MFDPEAPREMMPTDAMMKFYNCSDFPFNFNFIVDLTVLTLLDDLTGELSSKESCPGVTVRRQFKQPIIFREGFI